MDVKLPDSLENRATLACLQTERYNSSFAILKKKYFWSQATEINTISRKPIFCSVLYMTKPLEIF